MAMGRTATSASTAAARYRKRIATEIYHADEALDPQHVDCEFGDCDAMTHLQAVLALLPSKALLCDEKPGRQCSCCAPREHAAPREELAQLALLEARMDFSDLAEELLELEVVSATEDLACLVDERARRLYLSVRGTDVTCGRDLGNDVLLALGCSLPRVDLVEEEWRKARERFPWPRYAAYGCGHSLGGTVMNDLAYRLQHEDQFSFKRVDVFNAGGSPLRRKMTHLTGTDFLSHRVSGDLISVFYEPVGRDLYHPNRKSRNAHVMAHFLPNQRSALEPQEEAAQSWWGRYVFCCSRPGKLDPAFPAATQEHAEGSESSTSAPVAK